MPSPAPRPVTAEHLPHLARTVLQDDRFEVLATVDGDRPRARPTSATRTDGFAVCFAGLRRSRRAGELARNPNVGLCFLDDGDDQVRNIGVAERVTDRATRAETFARDPRLRQHLKSPDS